MHAHVVVPSSILGRRNGRSVAPCVLWTLRPRVGLFLWGLPWWQPGFVRVAASGGAGDLGPRCDMRLTLNTYSDDDIVVFELLFNFMSQWVDDTPGHKNPNPHRRTSVSHPGPRTPRARSHPTETDRVRRPSGLPSGP